MSVSEMAVDASAFDLVPQDYDGRRAALCLHGLTGTPYEMRHVAETLVTHGIRCFGPVMEGHAGSVDALARTSSTAWVDAARKHFESLTAQCERVSIVGMSMGGLVTLALACENRASAVAVMGTPIDLPWWVGRFVPLAKNVYPHRSKSEGSDIREPGARARHPGLEAMPLSSIHELVKLQARVRPLLSTITLPIFVAHGAHDFTADPRNAFRIFGAVNSGERALYIGPESGHVISVDYDASNCARAIAHFFDKIEFEHPA